MDQIMKDQVNNKLTTLQTTNQGNIMGTGSALNKNPDSENANGAIFLNNMLKEIIGKDLLTFTTAPDHRGLELPQFDWHRANKLMPEKTEEQKKHNDIQNKAEAIAVLQRLQTESHKTRMARV